MYWLCIRSSQVVSELFLFFMFYSVGCFAESTHCELQFPQQTHDLFTGIHNKRPSMPGCLVQDVMMLMVHPLCFIMPPIKTVYLFTSTASGRLSHHAKVDSLKHSTSSQCLTQLRLPSPVKVAARSTSHPFWI